MLCHHQKHLSIIIPEQNIQTFSTVHGNIIFMHYTAHQSNLSRYIIWSLSGVLLFSTYFKKICCTNLLTFFLENTDYITQISNSGKEKNYFSTSIGFMFPLHTCWIYDLFSQRLIRKETTNWYNSFIREKNGLSFS